MGFKRMIHYWWKMPFYSNLIFEWSVVIAILVASAIATVASAELLPSNIRQTNEEAEIDQS